MLLNHPHLANKKALREFTHELLWDSWPSLTTLCDRLQSKRSQLASLWGAGARCAAPGGWRRCCWILTPTSTTPSPSARRYKAFVDSLSFRVAADGASVSLGSGLERPLVQGGEDFGLFQGLVWELRLPLRRDVLTQRAPVVAAFLDKADLMDFPGVSNEHEGAKKITNDILAADLVRGLTEVLKRGKTASIAVSRAAELDIDGFSILARAGKHPGQPKQLVSGIQSWMRAYGQKWPPQGRVMPLNLVITFCAKLVNDVCQSGIRNGLDSYFSLFSKLADLADPRVVTMFTTTYPGWSPRVAFSFPKTKCGRKWPRFSLTKPSSSALATIANPSSKWWRMAARITFSSGSPNSPRPAAAPLCWPSGSRRPASDSLSCCHRIYPPKMPRRMSAIERWMPGCRASVNVWLTNRRRSTIMTVPRTSAACCAAS
jgi:hypothetical protein